MANTSGNLSKSKPEAQIVAQAKELQGMYLVVAAKQLGVGHERLRKISAKYGLKFRFRADDKIHQVKDEHKPRIYNMRGLHQKDGYWLKMCSVCKQDLGVEYFHADPTKKTELASACRQCRSVQSKANRAQKKSERNHE